MSNDPTAQDLIPLAAAAVPLGYTPASAGVLLSKGKFPVPVHKQGRYNMVDRGDVEAKLKSRPHLTQDQLAAVVKAREAAEAGVPVSPTASGDPVVELLSGSQWVSTAEVAQLLGKTAGVVNNLARAGKLPFALEPDPSSPRGGRRAASLDVAAYLASQERAWPSAEEFSAVPSLSLAEVKRALGDESPAGADDPVTQAFLASRETISLADYALMLGIAQDTLKVRIQREEKALRDGKKTRAQIIETVEEPKATGTERKLKRIRSDYAAAQLSKGHSDI